VGVGRIDVVSDAGPLIHLAEIDCLSLLVVFENLHVPETICREVFNHGLSWADVFGMGLVQQYTLSRSEVAQFIKANNLEGLHHGEQECLYLCKQTGIQVLLTDDLAVRESARHLNLIPVGSLGVVVKAYRVGQISRSAAESYLNNLYQVSSLFVTRTIVELAIEQLSSMSI
jgi:predicted nucleic acid-binding protein